MSRPTARAGKAYKDYEKAIVQAKKAYCEACLEAIAPAWKVYQEAIAQAEKNYKETITNKNVTMAGM